jgi:hypothetical protein
MMTSMFYYYELRESDGNDCTVYDIVIEAGDRDAADTQIAEHFDAEAKAKNWDADGSLGGYMFPCDCEQPTVPEEEIPCPDCAMLNIDGVPCHETGCPQDARIRRAQRAADRFECDGHGGLSLSDATEHASEEEALEECSMFHTRYEL